jgi:arylsulfatase
MVRWIEESAKTGKPFFAYWAPNAPHFPLHARKRDIEKYKGVYDVGPEAISEARVARMRKLGILEQDMPWELPQGFANTSPRQRQIYSRQRDRRPYVWTEAGNRKAESFEEIMMAYAAQVDCMDQNVGKVVAKLKQLGLYDNTLILFCSDNGASDEPPSSGVLWGQASNTPFREHKASSYDGGVGTPLIMHWPKRIDPAVKGSINRTWGHLIDIMPTVLAAAGGTYPKKDLQGHDLPALDGRSLLPALEGRHVPLEHPIFIEHNGNCALITEDWKLLAEDGSRVGPWSLYNMKTDRCELTDVAKDHPDVVEKLNARWHAMAERFGALRGGKRAAQDLQNAKEQEVNKKAQEKNITENK